MADFIQCSCKEDKTCRFLKSLYFIIVFVCFFVCFVVVFFGQPLVIWLTIQKAVYGDRSIFSFSKTLVPLSLEGRRWPAQAICLWADKWLCSRLYSWGPLTWVELPASSTTLQMVHGRLRCCFLETYLYKCPDTYSLQLMNVSFLQPLISIYNVACSSWQSAWVRQLYLLLIGTMTCAKQLTLIRLCNGLFQLLSMLFYLMVFMLFFA